MNDTTLFLAQLMGPTLAFIGLGIFLNRGFYKKVFNAMGAEDFDMLLTPMLMIPIGVLMVSKHFLWGSFPEILISIVGLAILFKGAMIALMPTAFKGLIKSLLSNGLMAFAGLLWLVGGGYLSWVGFVL